MAVAEKEPTAEGGWKEVAVSEEDEALRAKDGGSRAAAMLAEWKEVWTRGRSVVVDRIGISLSVASAVE